MMKIISEKGIDDTIKDSVVIVPSFSEQYYKNKYYGNCYNITTLRKFVLDNYDCNGKLTNKFQEFIIMLKAFLNVKDKLKRYKDFYSVSFVNDLLETYQVYDEFDLIFSNKVSDLSTIYHEYEELLKKKGLINYKMVLNWVINNTNFNSNYLFLNLEYLDDKELKIFKKMSDGGFVYVLPKLLNNENLFDKLSMVDKTNLKLDFKSYDGKEVVFKGLNDVQDELSFVLNDISKKVMEGNKYRDFIIVSNDIDTYLPYVDLIFDIPYSKKKQSGVLTSRFIKLFSNMLNGDFSYLNFINLLKLDLFNVTSLEVDKIDNYVYEWNLENENFYKPFTYNPNGNKAFTDKDKKLLQKLNDIKDSVVLPIKCLLENVAGERSVSANLKWFYTYLSEEKIDEKLNEKDPDGLSSFISLLENINDYLDIDMGIGELFSLISSNNLLSSKNVSMVDEVSITNMKDANFENKKFVYLIGASSDVLPGSFKLPGLISFSDLKKEQLIKLANNFQKEENYNLSKVLNNDFVMITYHKLSPDLKLKNFSNDLLNLKFTEELDERIYNVSLIENDYALKLSKNEVLPCNISIFNHINKSNKHDINKKISNVNAVKLYTNNLVISPSSIETYCKCAFYHFCQYGLKLKVKEKHLFDSREVGTFVHYVLENIIKNDYDFLNEENTLQLIEKYASNYLEDNNKLVNNVTLYTIKELSKNVSIILKNIINEQKISKFKPKYFEFKIGNLEKIKPINIKLDNGDLSIIGTVDRIDVFDDEENHYYRVIDYKTGNKKFRLDDVLAGLNLQMLLYVFSIKENGINHGKKLIPAGFFYYPSLLKETCVSRNLTKEELNLSVINRLKMNGMLNYDKVIYDALGGDLFSTYADIFQRGKLSEEKIYNVESLELLFDNVKKTLKTIGNDILDGKVLVNPKNKDTDVCEYCKFKSICKFDQEIDKKIKIPSYSNKEVFQKLEGEKDA